MPQDPGEWNSLIVRPGQPLIGVPVEEDGQQLVRYFTDEATAAATFQSEQSIGDALSVIGAWSDLDWEEAAAEPDRVRHESPRTPPVEPRRRTWATPLRPVQFTSVMLAC